MFHAFICKTLGKIRTRRDSRTVSTLLDFPQNPCLKSFSSVTKPSSTVDYLINSFGLSPESALRASKRIDHRAKTRPDSVLNLLTTHGLSKSEISKLVTKYPLVLLSDVEKILKPKFEFFSNIGISGPILAKIISSDPYVLTRSLENQIIPSVNFLRSLIPEDDVAGTIKRATWILHSIENTMGPNIGTLRKHGVPESKISILVIRNPRALVLRPGQFIDTVLELKEMGVNPSAPSLKFVRCFGILAGINKTAWEAKCAVYKSFGWSDNEIISLFKKQPIVMAPSEAKMRKCLEFFMNKLNWTVTLLSKYPTVILLSLEKRVIPRCSVLQVLVSMDLLKKSQMGTALIVAEDKFLSSYVHKYQKEVPELMKTYNTSKLSLVNSDIGSEDVSL